MAQVHAINSDKAIKAIKQAIAIASVVNKDLTFKANAKDSKFVLEDTSRPRTKAKDKNTADNCHPLENSCKLCEPVAIWATKRLYRFA